MTYADKCSALKAGSIIALSEKCWSLSERKI